MTQHTSGTNTVELSVLIVSYNCFDWLVEAIQSVNECVKLPFEIIVVDNASSDQTPLKVREQFPNVKLIANEKNRGFSAANNQGFFASTGNKILLLNPDARLINTNIQLGIDYLNLQPQTILGPKILNTDLSLQNSVYPYPSFFQIVSETFFLSYLVKRNLPLIVNRNQYALSGACLLLTKENYALLGGLDENLFWMDDVDFCFRAKKRGIAIVYFPDWSIIHAVGVSGRKNYKLTISNQLISKLKFFKKHNLGFQYGISAVLTEVHILLRLLLFLPLSPFKEHFRQKFFAYAYTQSLFFKYIFTGKKDTF